MATYTTTEDRGFHPERPVRKTTKSFARRIRDLHLYLGTFFAPAILFFAFSGALQTFNLHEGHPGEPYQPPTWIRILAQIHKEQQTELPPPRPEPPSQPKEQSPGPPPEEHEGVSKVLTQWFVLATSIGLIGSTLLGIYMAYAFTPKKSVTSVLLLLGFLVPMVFLLV